MPYQLLLPIFGIVAIIIFVMYRANLGPFSRTSPARRPLRDQTPDNSYPAVSVRCAPGGCDAAKALKGQRFLCQEAPDLPVPECASGVCGCRYQHHTDRRSGNNGRRNLQQPGTEDGLSPRADLREGLGRRASDWLKAYQMNTPSNA